MAYVKKRRVYKKKPMVKKVYRKRPNVKAIVRRELMKTVEKKRQVYTMIGTDQTFGQCAGNANAYWSDDITPNMVPGPNSNARIGNEISVTSAYMTLQLRQMPACTAPVKCVFYMFIPKGNYTDVPVNAVTQLWNTNNFIGTGATIYDTGSDMNIDQMNNFRIIRKFTVYVKPDQFSGQQMPVAKSIGLKFKRPLKIKWPNTSGNSQIENRIFFVGFCSAGNASAATASTLANIPITTANTGLFINYSIKWYYTDS